MKKSNNLLNIAMLFGFSIAQTTHIYAETYLTIEEAKQVMLENIPMTRISVELTKEQRKSIRKTSGVRVPRSKINAWKTDDGGWFIVDQVVGKHEMIDFAIALSNEGKVIDIEVLEYRETYGGEIRNPKWLAQFLGKDYTTHFEIDENVKNISGATLSSVHITEGVNRLLITWEQILKKI